MYSLNAKYTCSEFVHRLTCCCLSDTFLFSVILLIYFFLIILRFLVNEFTPISRCSCWLRSSVVRRLFFVFMFTHVFPRCHLLHELNRLLTTSSIRNVPRGERLSGLKCWIIRINGLSDGFGINYCKIGLYRKMQEFKNRLLHLLFQFTLWIFLIRIYRNKVA